MRQTIDSGQGRVGAKESMENSIVNEYNTHFIESNDDDRERDIDK